nr:unnamed protein product [Digitaria exilis]
MSMKYSDQTTGGPAPEQPPAEMGSAWGAEQSDGSSREQGGRATHLGGEVLEEAVLADAVLEAELLPELHPDLVPALPHLDRDDLARHFPLLLRRQRRVREGRRRREGGSPAGSGGGGGRLGFWRAPTASDIGGRGNGGGGGRLGFWRAPTASDIGGRGNQLASPRPADRKALSSSPRSSPPPVFLTQAVAFLRSPSPSPAARRSPSPRVAQSFSDLCSPSPLLRGCAVMEYARMSRG